jgi:hypothetical protein
VDADIVPAINGGSLVDRTQVDQLTAETPEMQTTTGRRVLRSTKGSDNARQDAEAKLTRALTAANKAMKDRRVKAHADLAKMAE